MMKPPVHDQLVRIAELYPAPRLEASKRRISAVWRREQPPDRYPFTYMPCVLDYYDTVYPNEVRLELALREAVTRAFLDDDFIPTLFPGCRQNTIPSMFGAPEDQPRILRTPDDIRNLPEPRILPGSLAEKMLETMRYMVGETDGALPVNVMDMQGPVEVAAKMWGYEEFFIHAYTDPELCHALMAKLARAFTLLWEEQVKIAGANLVPNHLWGWNWAPSDIGASLSSDGLVMVSGDFCREFYNPSTEAISRHFGGITVHSCGDFSATIPAVLELENLRCIHAGQMSIAELHQAGVRDHCTVIAFSPCAEFAAAVDLMKREKISGFLSLIDFWSTAGVSGDLQEETNRHACLELHRTLQRAALVAD